MSIVVTPIISATRDQWLETTAVIIQNRILYETDTGNYKVGDGTNVYSALPYTQNQATYTNYVFMVPLDDLKDIFDNTSSSSDGSWLVDGTSGEVLISNGNNVPSWSSIFRAPSNTEFSGYVSISGELYQGDNGTTSSLIIEASSDSYTNIGLSLSPLGNGAINAGPAPDGQETGGNSRGINAIDFQITRSDSGQVASGDYSAILSGQENQNDGYASIIGSGLQNTIVETNLGYSAIFSGNNNVITVDYSVIVNGLNNSITGSGTNNAILGGTNSNISGGFSVIGGGSSHEVSGNYDFTGGGEQNYTGGNYAVVVGGSNQNATEDCVFIGGGQENNALATYAVVCGGLSNYSAGNCSFVGAGTENYANADYSVTVGGNNNGVYAEYSIIIGGADNTLSTSIGYSIIVGGSQNQVESDYSVLVGGEQCTVSGGDHNFLGGGYQCEVSGCTYSVVVGGYGNGTNGNNYAIVVGGQGNHAEGDYSIILGGNTNSATYGLSLVLNGTNNGAYAEYAFVATGLQNMTAGTYSTVLNGSNNVATGEYSTILNGNNACDQRRIGWTGYSTGYFSQKGDQQAGLTILSGITSTGTLILTSGNINGTYTAPSNAALANGTNNIINLVPYSVLRIKGTILGADTITQDSGSWDIDFVIKQGADATSTIIVGTPKISLIAADAAFVPLAISVTADTVNGGPNINISNASGWTNISYFEANLIISELIIPQPSIAT